VADLGTENAAQVVVDEVLRTFGKIDVLVNNVGIRRYEALADAPWDTWDAIVRVNLLSFVSMARAALPALRQSGRGSVINVSSTYAVYGRKGMGAYDATKAAVLSLTRTLAFEEGTHGVRVNALCPGFTRTPFHFNRLGTAKVDELVPPCELQRWADLNELAYPMLWLASDEASYVTSATFMTMAAFQRDGCCHFEHDDGWGDVLNTGSERWSNTAITENGYCRCSPSSAAR
jgi:NAD(P)-dependent dehydrogenase (short-subunit alcohol dehydrogenase family)